MAEKTKTIGIMGGGQLGLMIVEQAHLLGARTLCLDPAPDAPAFALSDGHIVAAYDDAAAPQFGALYHPVSYTHLTLPTIA